MSRRATWESPGALYARYQRASPIEKSRILGEGGQVCGDQRQDAIRRLTGPPPPPPRGRRQRPTTSSAPALSILTQVWDAAGSPWSVRLKALLPVWLPWIRPRFTLTPSLRAPRPDDQRAADRPTAAGEEAAEPPGLDGRATPGTLRAQPIPIKTDPWAVTPPGSAEIDRVSRSGDGAAGDFVYSLTDLHTTGTEARAGLGKGAPGLEAALEDRRRDRPGPRRGIDADPGRECLNPPRWRSAQRQPRQVTRSRPDQKDDTAHGEQKPWTHGRQRLAGERDDPAAAGAASNRLDQRDLRLCRHRFQPSMKLAKQGRVGSHRTRRDDAAQTPLDRVADGPEADPRTGAARRQRRARLDPFVLAQRIDNHLERRFRLATRPRRRGVSPRAPLLHPSPRPPSNETTTG